MTRELELGPCIGGGDQAKVFECGQDVCKLYGSHIDEHVAKLMADREALALKLVEAFDDVPAPRVLGVRQIRGQWGVIMSRINGQNFARALSGGQGPTPYLEEMARLHVAIHRHRAPGLPSLKAWLGDEIQQAEANLGAALQSVLDRLAEIPHSDRLCHGDFQPLNVMGKPGNAWIIDWTHATQGDPAIDVCQSWLLMQRSEKELAAAYVEAYAKESGREPDDFLRWAPIVASARLGNVPSEADSLTPIVFEGLSR